MAINGAQFAARHPTREVGRLVVSKVADELHVERRPRRSFASPGAATANRHRLTGVAAEGGETGGDVPWRTSVILRG